MTERTAIVIGAGHNGLVCATYLAKAGFNVRLVEASDKIGGMAAPRVLGGEYHLPGLAHAAYPVSPQVQKELNLARHGLKAGSGLATIALDDDGRHVEIGTSGIDGPGLAQDQKDAWQAFAKEYEAFSRAIRPLMDGRPPRLKNMPFADKKTLASLAWKLRFGLGRDAMNEFLRVAGMNVYDVLDEAFEDPLLKGALAADAVLGSAMGPRTPGTVLTWLQRQHGALGGPLAMVDGTNSGLIGALENAAVAAGVKINTGTRVGRILVEKGVASGVELVTGERAEAAVIVSGIDARSTLNGLVGSPALDAMFANRVSQIRGTGSVGKLHLALSGLPTFKGLKSDQLEQRLLHAPDMRYVERAFNHIKYNEFSASPVLEITIPSLHNLELAPDGHHVMSINVSFVPHTLDEGWEAGKPRLKAALMNQLEMLAPGIQELVVHDELLTPADIETETGIKGGHWHHGELSMHQSFMMRPVYGAAQYDTPVDGLFLCSAGCHPGGGLSGIPGRNAAQRIQEMSK